MSAYRWDAVIDEGMAEPPFLAKNRPGMKLGNPGFPEPRRQADFRHPRRASRVIDFSGIASIYPAIRYAFVLCYLNDRFAD